VSSSDTSRISPTAHFTAYVWYRHGLSVPELATPLGRLFYNLARPANLAFQALGRADMESMMLTRHRVIDHLLAGAIESGKVGQVIEIAAGLSPRGLRFRRRFPKVRYIEADLPEMVKTKTELLGGKFEHEMVSLNALMDEGDDSLFALSETLDRSQGVALVLEGLVNYFDEPTIREIFARVRRFMAAFPYGVMLSDFYLREDTLRNTGARTVARALNLIVRGQTHMPYRDDQELLRALESCGYEEPRIHMAGDFAGSLDVASPRRSGYVRVIEAFS
jgi:O-methyltransferase involved in polyketide biosynthesis